MRYYHLFWDMNEKKPYIVKRGFNFFAFIFGFLYFIYFRAWYSFGVFLAANIFVVTVQMIFQMPELLSILMNAAFNLYVGSDANDCLYGEYCKKGYRYIKSDFYTSEEHAIKDIFDKMT